jgi:hypothetical protein
MEFKKIVETTSEKSILEHIKKRIQGFEELLDPNISDEIPEEIIHGRGKDGQEYKIQTGWFNAVSAELYLLKNKPDIKLSSDLMIKINTFELNMLRRINPSQGFHPTRDDVNAAKNLIQEILKELKNKI